MVSNMKTWEKNIRRVTPYVPGEQPDISGMIKLNTNENPYPPAPGVKKVLKEMDTDTFRLYPDATVSKLAQELASFYKLKKEQVFVGVGSDDVLATCFLTFFNSNMPVFFPDITYLFYPVWCDLYKIPYVTQALDENFNIVKEDYYKENGGIVIANPNAPTSIYAKLDLIEDIISHNRNSIVIIDEAYIDFSGPSALSLINKYDNLVIVQTFSKSRSMAGMRIGYAMANPDLIKALNDVKYSINSYTMNQTAILTGVEAVRDEAYFRENIKKIIATRERTQNQLHKLGFSFPKSGTNFIFAAHEKIAAADIYNELRRNNIFVRYFNLPRINNYLRISIGKEEEMDKLISFLAEYIKNHA